MHSSFPVCTRNPFPTSMFCLKSSLEFGGLHHMALSSGPSPLPPLLSFPPGSSSPKILPHQLFRQCPFSCKPIVPKIWSPNQLFQQPPVLSRSMLEMQALRPCPDLPSHKVWGQGVGNLFKKPSRAFDGC